MVWAKERTITLDVQGEELKVVYSLPLPEEWEEALPLLEGKVPKWTALCRKFVTKVEGLGLDTPDQLFTCPTASGIILAIGSDILAHASLEATLKNA